MSVHTFQAFEGQKKAVDRPWAHPPPQNTMKGLGHFDESLHDSTNSENSYLKSSNQYKYRFLNSENLTTNNVIL